MHAARELNWTHCAKRCCTECLMQSTCACRRSLIGDGLDMIVHLESIGPESGSGLRAGLLLLLHLCNPTQYGADMAATAGAALVVLMTGGYGAFAPHSSEDTHLVSRGTAALHSDVLIAAMQYEGFAAALAEQRQDAITTLASVAYRDPTDAAGELQEAVVKKNEEVFDVFAAGAVQVKP